MPELSQFYKSSYSTAKGENCVEVAVGTTIHMRDSTSPNATRLTFDIAEWRAFVAGVTHAEM